MARYQLLDRTFINGSLREKGEVVEYDGQPGSTLQPLDVKPAVDIPDDWREQNGLQRIALARSLGAPKRSLSAADADLWIGNELDNRATQKAQKPTPAPKPFASLAPSTEPTAVVPSTEPETT